MVCHEFLFLKRRKESVSRPLSYPGYSGFISCLSIISQKKMFCLWAPEKMYFLAWFRSAGVHSWEVQFSLTVVGWKGKVMKQYVTNGTTNVGGWLPKNFCHSSSAGWLKNSWFADVWINFMQSNWQQAVALSLWLFQLRNPQSFWSLFMSAVFTGLPPHQV